MKILKKLFFYRHTLLGLILRLFGAALNLLILWVLNYYFPVGSATNYAIIWSLGLSIAQFASLGSNRIVYRFIESKNDSLYINSAVTECIESIVNTSFLLSIVFLTSSLFLYWLLGHVSMTVSLIAFVGTSISIYLSAEVTRVLQNFPLSIFLESVLFPLVYTIILVFIILSNNLGLQSYSIPLSSAISFLLICILFIKRLKPDFRFLEFALINIGLTIATSISQFVNFSSGRLPIYLAAYILVPTDSDTFSLVYGFVGFGGTALYFAQSRIAGSLNTSTSTTNISLELIRSRKISVGVYLLILPPAFFVMYTSPFAQFSIFLLVLFLAQLFRVSFGSTEYILARFGYVKMEMISILISASIFLTMSVFFNFNLDSFYALCAFYLCFRAIISHYFYKLFCVV